MTLETEAVSTVEPDRGPLERGEGIPWRPSGSRSVLSLEGVGSNPDWGAKILQT